MVLLKVTPSSFSVVPSSIVVLLSVRESVVGRFVLVNVMIWVLEGFRLTLHFLHQSRIRFSTMHQGQS